MSRAEKRGPVDPTIPEIRSRRSAGVQGAGTLPGRRAEQRRLQVAGLVLGNPTDPMARRSNERVARAYVLLM